MFSATNVSGLGARGHSRASRGRLADPLPLGTEVDQGRVCEGTPNLAPSILWDWGRDWLVRGFELSMALRDWNYGLQSRSRPLKEGVANGQIRVPGLAHPSRRR